MKPTKQIWKKGESIKYNSVAIHPNGICIYGQFVDNRRKFKEKISTDEVPNGEKEKKILSEEAKKKHLERISTRGFISANAAKKMNRAVGWLLHNSIPTKEYDRNNKRWIKFRICFCTLTLPSCQKHSDNKIKSVILNSFLEKLRRKAAVDLYLWRAEKQANGSIHFHLVINKYIPVLTMRKWWNDSCELLGYVSDYSAEMEANIKSFGDYYEKFINQGSYNDLMRRYNYGKASKWSNPNSTDIHNVKNVKRLSVYLMKYMSKNVDEEKLKTEQEKSKLLVNGQLWGLSEKLSKLLHTTGIITSEIWSEIDRVFEGCKAKVISDDFFDFICIPIKSLFKYQCTNLIAIIQARYKEIGLWQGNFAFYC